ncbi:MAG: hypothetical protein INR69_17770 [Mucilaginibacter polytrichastri]|nr:hypothetical protein [Mucilaginibacter polytrichastri]
MTVTETALSTLEKNDANKRLVIKEENLTAKFIYAHPGNDTAKTAVGLHLGGNDSLHVDVGTFPGKGITLKELDSPEMPKGSFIGSQVMDFEKGNGEEFVAYRCSDSTVRISKRHIEKNIPTEKFQVVKEVIVSPKTKIKADIGYKGY